ncbi:MAG: hypothetical protein ACFE75_05675 [Candidatus Hodarchaeota archaeon]
MPIIEGWEVSPDRHDKLEKMLSTDSVGDPIITSKCMLGKDNGLLIASDKGFAWRIQMGYSSSMYSAGKSKWVRWHDVAGFIPKKPGFMLAEVKVRKKGALVVDKKGYAKVKRWRLILRQNKNEDKSHFAQRRENFYNIMVDLHNRYKGDTDPPTSDSRI